MIIFGRCSCARRSHLVVVDGLGLRVAGRTGTTLNHLPEKLTGRAVGEVAAHGEVHAEDGVARLHDREVDRHVGLRAGVRLHVGVVGAEQLARAVAGDVLDDVDLLAAAVVALAGQPSAYLLVSTVPAASRTASDVKFSEAMSSIVPRWRASSASMAAATSGSCAGMYFNAMSLVLLAFRTSPDAVPSSAGSSMARISSTRAACRPPSNVRVRNASTILASPSRRRSKRAASVTTFASLCPRASSANSGS